MNEYEELISCFYDLSCEDKKKEINEELKKLRQVIQVVSQFKIDPTSNRLTSYDENNQDSEDQNLTKLYNDIMNVEEALVFYLKDNGY